MRIFFYLSLAVFTASAMGCVPGGGGDVAVPSDPENGGTVQVSLQKRVLSQDGKTYDSIVTPAEWKLSETAIIICDMWDKHWCTDATTRVAELAPALNNVLTIARDRGALIVHAPSDCMDYYKDDPRRKLAMAYKTDKYDGVISSSKLESEEGKTWPVDDSDEGCTSAAAGDKPHKAWTKQIDLIEIAEKDVISDSGAELKGVFDSVGIKNVILTGVHTNMCVIHRTFGLRNMTRLGMENVALMRDMTDAMYNPASWPYISHFDGIREVVKYIEKYIAPSMLSTDITGQAPFRFKDDIPPTAAVQ